MDKFAAYRAQYEERLIKAARNFNSAVEKIDEKYKQDMRGAKDRYNSELTAIHTRINNIAVFLGPSALDWSDKFWDSNYDSTAKTTGQSASELASPQKAETLI